LLPGIVIFSLYLFPVALCSEETAMFNACILCSLIEKLQSYLSIIRCCVPHMLCFSFTFFFLEHLSVLVELVVSMVSGEH
jgi:hypothetical protein